MRINVTGTRPGKAKPKGGKKKSDAGHGKVKLTRAQKIKNRRATARERRHVVVVGRYQIKLHPDFASTTAVVYGSARMHGDEDTEGYPGRRRPRPATGGAGPEQPRPGSKKESNS